MLLDQLEVVNGLPEKGIAPGRLGIRSIDSFRYVVTNPDRSRSFYLDGLGFKEIAQARPEKVKEDGWTTTVYGGGRARVEVCAPISGDSRAGHFLRAHPDGISNITFRVRDIEYAERFLRERGACFLDPPPEDDKDGGTCRAVMIATPLGDVTFTFVERSESYDNYAPGFERTGEMKPKTEFNYKFVDHITSNTLTMMPTIWFYYHVMGFEEYWAIKFHSADSTEGKPECLDWHKNSGLRSIVMHDPQSKIKFATNEPLAPAYYNSQIATYCADNFGAGVQHVALAVPDICESVQELLDRDVLFLDAPDTYFDELPERMELKRILELDQPVSRLRELGILLDGEDNHYLLQIFLKDSADHYKDTKAGPFFYELIQRRGSNGFGEGNFRALFDAIEKNSSVRRPLM